jgi:hypothetical protein
MTVTFLRVARSSAAKRSSRRSRPAAREAPVEARREWGAARGVVATLIMLRTPRAQRTRVQPPAASLAATKSDSTTHTLRFRGLDLTVRQGLRCRRITSIR